MKTRPDMTQDLPQLETSAPEGSAKGPLGVRSLSLRAVLEAQRQSLLAPEPELVVLPADEGEAPTPTHASLESAASRWLRHRDMPFVSNGLEVQRNERAIASAPEAALADDQALAPIEVCEMPGSAEESPPLAVVASTPVSSRTREARMAEQPYGKDPAQPAEALASLANRDPKRADLLSRTGSVLSGPLRYIKLAEALAATGAVIAAPDESAEPVSAIAGEPIGMASFSGSSRLWQGQGRRPWFTLEAGDAPLPFAHRFAPVTQPQQPSQIVPETVICDANDIPDETCIDVPASASEYPAAALGQQLNAPRAGRVAREMYQLEQPFGLEPVEAFSDLPLLNQPQQTQEVQPTSIGWLNRTRYGYIKFADVAAAAPQPEQATSLASEAVTTSADSGGEAASTPVDISAVRRWMLTDPSLALVDRWAQMEAALVSHDHARTGGLLGGETTYGVAQVSTESLVAAPEERLVGMRRPRGELVR